ncbi:MAG: hypothetical protein AB7G28_18515 [Pirellulales bacterium]
MKSQPIHSVWLACLSLAGLLGGVLPEAGAQSRSVMGIDGMVALHLGLFRNNLLNEGVNTFQFGAVTLAAGELGRYQSFRMLVPGGQIGGLTANGRIVSDSPESFVGTYEPVTPVTPAHAALLDRAVSGALFDPAEYQIEVKFKPISTPAPIANSAASFNVALEQIDGFMTDAESGLLKRANERFLYQIGSPQTPINSWYAGAAKDTEGFATWTVPVTSPTFALKGFYHRSGDGVFRDEHVVGGGGRVFNPATSMYEDVLDGPDFDAFGDPESSLDVPNGLASLGIESMFGDPTSNLSIDVRSVLVKKVQPDPLVILRLDERSGLTHRFGTALAYNPTNPAPGSRPQDSAIDIGDGATYSPIATDQIRRFDDNGMLDYLSINPRQPLAPQEGYSLLLRDAPSGNSFDGNQAVVVVRARLSAALSSAGTAQEITLMLKDLDGNDNGGNPVGADEYTYALPLNLFNTQSFTTVAIPLSSFVLSPHVPTGVISGSGPFGFANPGDGSRSAFNPYEFGIRVPPSGGLLRLDLDYLDVRAVPEPGAVVLLLPALALCGRRVRFGRS